MNENIDKNQIENKERTLLDGLILYLSYLIRHKYLIIIFTVLAAIGSVTFSIISLKLPPEKSPLPNYYRAYSVLLISQNNSSDMSTMLSSMGIQSVVSHGEVNYGELGITVMRSRPFLDEIVKDQNIINRYDLKKNFKTTAREIILNNSNFQYISRTGTLTISYEAIDPTFARDVVKSMVSNLQTWFRNWEGSSSQQEMNAMQDKIVEISHELNLLESKIQAFQTKYGVLSVEQLAEAQTAMITELQRQLIQTEVAIKNYSGFSTFEDQELIQLKAESDSLKELIMQIEQGGGGGGRPMPSREELPALALEYSHLQMSHEIQMSILQNLKEQFEVQKLASTGASMFSVLEPAEIPDEKSRPSRSKLCIIVTIIGFLSSIAFALIADVVRQVKNDPEKKKILKGK